MISNVRAETRETRERCLDLSTREDTRTLLVNQRKVFAKNTRPEI